jgi:hypothetical protein
MGIFSKLFGRKKKLEGVLDSFSDVIPRCDGGYDFRETIRRTIDNNWSNRGEEEVLIETGKDVVKDWNYCGRPIGYCKIGHKLTDKQKAEIEKYADDYISFKKNEENDKKIKM